jgi:hypothetical protein
VLCGESQCKVKSRTVRTAKLEAIAYDADASVAPAFAEARATRRALPTPYHVPVSHMDRPALHPLRPQRTACGILRQDARDGVKATAIRSDLFALLFAGAFLHQARLANKQQTLTGGIVQRRTHLRARLPDSKPTTSRFHDCDPCRLVSDLRSTYTHLTLAPRPTWTLPTSDKVITSRQTTHACDARIKRCLSHTI